MDSSKKYNGLLIQDQQSRVVNDAIALEHPLSISVNGEIFTMTMQSPGQEVELARGLLFSEGVWKNRNAKLVWEEKERSDDGFLSQMNVLIPDDQVQQSQLNKRSLLSVASCGICGKTELSIPENVTFNAFPKLSVGEIKLMFNTMQDVQDSFRSSGGCHGASIFSKEKKMLAMHEDIGRHNAVDKVIGQLLEENLLDKATFLLVSGRVSYEIIVKCFSAGIPFLLAVSAPSSLAIDFAKELGITLLGFCREDRATIYSHPERVF
jgi:FdhD protein